MELSLVPDARRLVCLSVLPFLPFFLNPHPSQAMPSIVGFNFPAWQKDAYSSPDTQKSLEQLAQTGARWVAIVPTWYMKSPSDSDIHRTEMTASDESLRQIIQKAKSLGLHVALKPHVDLEDGSRRSLLEAKDPKAWFESYRKFILTYARLAAEEQVDLFIVGTELVKMSKKNNRDDWAQTIREVRGVYPGRLTYAATWHDYKNIPFWGSLDFIGVNGYFPLLGGRNHALLGLTLRFYLRSVKEMAHRYDKPVLFTEIGLTSQRGASLRPVDYRKFGRVDLKVQKAYLEVLLGHLYKQSYFAGFLYWAWDIAPNAGGPQDRSMTVQGKPALDVLKYFFSRSQSLPPSVNLPSSKTVQEKMRFLWQQAILDPRAQFLQPDQQDLTPPILGNPKPDPSED